MSRVGRNDPCPCGSDRKFKRCCIGQEAELERREQAAAHLLGLAAAFPLLRPIGPDVEAWASAHEGAEPSDSLLEEGVALARDEREDIGPWFAARYPQLWEELSEAIDDVTEARELVLLGGIAALLEEPRDLDGSALDWLEETASDSDDAATTLADVVDACALWSVAEAATLANSLDAAGDLDDDAFGHLAEAIAGELWTERHTARLGLLVDRVRRALPAPGRPRASAQLAAAVDRFAADAATRAETAALLLTDTLGPLRALENAMPIAA